MVCSAYAFLPEKTGTVYLATMTGAAFGAFFPMPVLAGLGLERSVFVSAVIPLILLPFNVQGGWKKLFLFISIPIGGTAAVLFFFPQITKVSPSPYKSLSQMLQFPDTKIMETSTTLQGRMDEVKSPYIRFAPGLSLKFPDRLPRQ